MKSEERIRNEMEMYENLIPELNDRKQRKECRAKINILCWVLR